MSRPCDENQPNRTDQPPEAETDADESPIEGLGKALKKVSDAVGCRANVVLDHFEKPD